MAIGHLQCWQMSFTKPLIFIFFRISESVGIGGLWYWGIVGHGYRGKHIYITATGESHPTPTHMILASSTLPPTHQIPPLASSSLQPTDLIVSACCCQGRLTTPGALQALYQQYDAHWSYKMLSIHTELQCVLHTEYSVNYSVYYIQCKLQPEYSWHDTAVRRPTALTPRA